LALEEAQAGDVVAEVKGQIDAGKVKEVIDVLVSWNNINFDLY